MLATNHEAATRDGSRGCGYRCLPVRRSSDRSPLSPIYPALPSRHRAPARAAGSHPARLPSSSGALPRGWHGWLDRSLALKAPGVTTALLQSCKSAKRKLRFGFRLYSVLIEGWFGPRGSGGLRPPPLHHSASPVRTFLEEAARSLLRLATQLSENPAGGTVLSDHF